MTLQKDMIIALSLSGWLTVLTLTVAVCRAAAFGDEVWAVANS
jgi:hypothetical protein